jgi:hypothetical protein
MGFKVYRMNDSLQGSFPCFVRIDFGSGVAAGNPGIRISIGTAHDGAGLLTGSQVAGGRICNSSYNSAVAMNCYCSGDTGRIVVAMFANNDANAGITFFIERTKDAAGADDSTGIVWAHVGQHTTSTINIGNGVIPPSGGVPPFQGVWTISVPAQAGGFSNGTDTEYGLGTYTPWMGKALRPVLSFVAMNPTDAPAYNSTIATTFYGSARTYISLGTLAYGNMVNDATGANRPCRLLMRYD